MALPKALLCLLGKNTSDNTAEEAALRAAGFATASISWGEISAQRNGWTQLVPVLEDPAVQAWMFAGKPEEFTEEVLSHMTLLSLALRRPKLPVTACVLTANGREPEFPELLGHVRVFAGNAGFAAKLAAIRLKPPTLARPDFHLRVYADPLVGLWIETGPAQGEAWKGFMAGVTEAEVTAFGIGPRGAVPQKTFLEYPQCGIKGNWGERDFTSCAAQNTIDARSACYMRVEGTPQAVFVTAHRDDSSGDDWLRYAAFV